MTTVKNITIPEGSVKKIEDSNGNIIWASYDLFPYRRLEYVTTNNDAAIDTGITAATNQTFYTKFRPTSSTSGEQHRIIANYTPGATLVRKYPLMMFGGNQTIQNVLGSSWEGSTVAQLDQDYVVTTSVNYNSRFIKVNDGTQESLTSVSQDTGTSGNNYGYGSCWNSGNSKFEYGLIGRLYGMKTNGTSSYGIYFIPAQRKSDGKVGFCKITKNILGSVTFNGFYPSTSTNDFGAGPVTDEYFDTSVAPTLGF